ncbi:MAG TPA: MaoC family dehydratase N-terminal domain-containing protein [Acidimicrobiales bacterium]
MAVDTSKIGMPTFKARVTLERGPLSLFAGAVTDESAIYRSGEAALAAGFDGVPAPPTFPFAMQFTGKFPEDQPPDAGDQNAVLGVVVGPLMAKGGIILHGEQAFEYHQPMTAGMVLDGEGVVEDIYEKESKGKTMTFVVTKESWTDAATGEPVVTARMNLIHRI